MWAVYRRRSRSREITFDPVGKLVRLLLEQAVQDKSPLICFGQPREVPAPARAPVSPPSPAEEAESSMLAAVGGSAEDHETAAKLVAASSYVRCWDGSTRMPLWYMVESQFHQMMPPTITVALLALHKLQDMLVAVGASAQDPQPLRYVELYAKQPGRRRFVAVEMTFEQDNTYRIKVLQLREEPAGIVVSSDCYGQHRVAAPPAPPAPPAPSA